MHTLSEFGIDLYWLAGFAAAALASFTFINPIITAFYNSVFRRLIPQAQDETPANIAQKRLELSSELRLDMGATIGRVERLFYIYAVMSTNFGALTAWIIMKAFFGWMDAPEKDSTTTQRDKFVIYYLYLYGTALSLLAGIALGHLGLTCANVARVMFPGFLRAT